MVKFAPDIPPHEPEPRPVTPARTTYTRHEVSVLLGCTKQTVKNLEDAGKLHRVGSSKSERGMPAILYPRDEVDALAEDRHRAALVMAPICRGLYTVAKELHTFAISEDSSEVLVHWIEVVNSSGKQVRVLCPRWTPVEIEQAKRFLKVGWRILIDGRVGETGDISSTALAVDVSSMVEYTLSLQTSNS